MNVLKLKDNYIKLGQALKASGLVSSGVDAKFIISEGLVKVDGETELRRGRKLYNGSMVEYDGQSIRIEAASIEE